MNSLTLLSVFSLVWQISGKSININLTDPIEEIWNSEVKILNRLPVIKERLLSKFAEDITLKSLTFDFKDYVKFFLYTKKNVDSYQQVFLNDVNSLKNSNYDASKPTYFVIHGYMDDVTAEIIQSIKNGILGQMEANVFAVDWSKIAIDIFYHIIAQEVPNVGEYIGKFMNFLIENGDSASNIHAIGHSLGAHAAGFAGKTVGSGKLKRISGLDPALPAFESAGKNDRIDASDANFVDCIHTCAGFLGYYYTLCQADFYPNGGENPQPGCLVIDFGVCSHGRSHEYFAESIDPNHKFSSQQCTSIPSHSTDGCVKSDALMGFPASKQYQGIFYSQTNSAYPYSQDVTVNAKNNTTMY
ncbi:hypothetical protein O3M35_007258 [Rhynocoris fuscipes]|uniref:Lipase domain-containing protein n=1 Tax=Rhynocoris fuscipes TaxID=488301 RepID=A0AAW1DE20_9HEMI